MVVPQEEWQSRQMLEMGGAEPSRRRGRGRSPTPAMYRERLADAVGRFVDP